MLELRAVDGSYGGIRALRNFDITVAPGSRTALLGRNGAGKSTALKLMSGGLLPSTGTITWNGKSIVTLPPEERVRLGIALVPEGRGIFPTLTVEENLKIGAFHSKPPPGKLKTLMDEAFRRMPMLVRLRHNLAGGLSGGEQQILTVARALMSRPKVLLLDEPSLGLAPKVVEELYKLLGSLDDGELAMVLVEQYVGFALELCSNAMVLSNGETVIRRSCDELRHNGSLTQAYLG